MKYVKITFKSAKLVIERPPQDPNKVNHILTNVCDYFKTENNRYTKCVDAKYYVDFEKPLVFSPITNMLHVLMGARPVPRNKSVLPAYKRCEKIDEIASKGAIKVTSVVSFVDENQNKQVVGEICRGKKLSWNSNMTGLYTDTPNGTRNFVFTWSSLYRKLLFDREKDYSKEYDELISTILRFAKLPEDHNKTLFEAFELIKKNGHEEEFTRFLQTKKVYGIVTSAFTDPEWEGVNKDVGSPLSLKINAYPQVKLTLDGEMIFPMTDDEYDIIMSGPKCATYLDGGFAKVTGTAINQYEMQKTGFIPISELPY